MAQTVANIKIEPMTVTIGEDIMQVSYITCVADVAASLNNKYFVFYVAAGTKHYGWYNVASGGTDPAVSGGTAHEIDIASGATAAAVASATQAVLDAVAGFDATVSDTVVTLTATAAGYQKSIHDGAAPTAFAFEVFKYGDSATDAGFTDGDLEVKMDYNDVDVTSHQTGSEVLSHINTGNNVSLTINLKETTVAQLRYAFLGRGDSVIPKGTGVSSTEVFGLGLNRQFKQTADRARKIVLHPKVLASTNHSRDLTIWKAFPSLETLNFSGENIFMIPMEVKVYNDFAKDQRISKICYGDSTQTLT